MSFLNRSPARDAWLILPTPFFSTRTSSSRARNTPISTTCRGVQGKSVALPRGTMVEERIRKDYPGLRAW